VTRLLGVLLLVACAVGEAVPPGGACAESADCGAGMYCARPDGGCLEPGRCEPRPELCTQDYRPVCGCDGQTWSNACAAAAAGVSVRRAGPCEK
jgi:hypothetical protein